MIIRIYNITTFNCDYNLAVIDKCFFFQVCNWFANWRRKLKNAGKEPHQKTWSDLIKTYNNQVQGNVEHFSITSEDSIWEASDEMSNYTNDLYENQSKEKHSEQNYLNNNNIHQNQCYYISSTTESDPENPFAQNKYKNHIMEKYIRDCQKPFDISEDNKPSMISKWLESAANFRPSENTYVDWTFTNKSSKKRVKKIENNNLVLLHGREELDAAEALTTLANSRFKV